MAPLVCCMGQVHQAAPRGLALGRRTAPPRRGRRIVAAGLGLDHVPQPLNRLPEADRLPGNGSSLDTPRLTPGTWCLEGGPGGGAVSTRPRVSPRRADSGSFAGAREADRGAGRCPRGRPIRHAKVKVTPGILHLEGKQGGVHEAARLDAARLTPGTWPWKADRPSRPCRPLPLYGAGPPRHAAPPPGRHRGAAGPQASCDS